MIGQYSPLGGRWRVLGPLLAVALMATACGTPGPAATGTPAAVSSVPPPSSVAPGDSIAASPSGITTEPVTLVVEDVSGENRDAALEAINAAFMAKYPNVTIERVRSSFTDLQPKQAIEMAGPNPPDVIEVVVPNDTFAKLGNEGLITNLDPYVEQYGWADRFPASLLDQGRFDAKGQILSGPHYGVYMVEDVVGIFYNKAKLAALKLEVPKTWEEFQSALATAKAAGEVPIWIGNLEKWPMGHVYGTIYNRYATTDDINGWTFNTKPDVSWDSAPYLKATQELKAWGDKGYFTPDFNAVGYDDATAQFGAGKGVFFPAGTWVTGTLEKAASDKLGFFLPPPVSSDPQVRVEGGQGQFWAISGKTKHPDVAAAYLDMLSSQLAGEQLIKIAAIPGFKMDSVPSIPSGLYSDVFSAVQEVNKTYTVSTYVDASTSTMLTTSGEGQQKLLAGQMTPEEYVASVQADHDAAYK